MEENTQKLKAAYSLVLKARAAGNLEDIGIELQSGASSRAKHGGAYFSAVIGSIKDPIAVPGWHEVPGV